MNDPGFVDARQRATAALSHELARHAVTTPHEAIPEAALKLVREYGLTPDDVQTIEVTVTPYIDRRASRKGSGAGRRDAARDAWAGGAAAAE